MRSGVTSGRNAACVRVAQPLLYPPETKVSAYIVTEAIFTAAAAPRYFAHIGVAVKTTEYITGNAARRTERLSSGPSGRGAAQDPAPRPSMMLRTLYLAFGVLALGWMMHREPQPDLLPRLRNAGF